MSERKAINKYYPPDWDPLKVVKRKRDPNQTIKIRMMAPYLMRCTKCNEYIAERRSFNARKETTNETYLKTKIIRFHITCPRCNNHISFKTNPQTAGYTPEEGAVRNYEPTRKVTSTNVPKDRQETEDELLQRLEKEEQENLKFQTLKERRKRNPFWNKQESLQAGGDVYENLEKRLLEQQREQQLNEHLEELQMKNNQLQAKGGSDKLIEEAKERLENELRELRNNRQEEQNKEDDERARNAFRKRSREQEEEKYDNKDDNILKKPAIESKEVHEEPIEVFGAIPSEVTIAKKITLKKKQPIDSNSANTIKVTSTIVTKLPTAPVTSLQDALVGYSSSDEE